MLKACSFPKLHKIQRYCVLILEVPYIHPFRASTAYKISTRFYLEKSFQDVTSLSHTAPRIAQPLRGSQTAGLRFNFTTTLAWPLTPQQILFFDAETCSLTLQCSSHAELSKRILMVERITTTKHLDPKCPRIQGQHSGARSWKHPPLLFRSLHGLME